LGVLLAPAFFALPLGVLRLTGLGLLPPDDDEDLNVMMMMLMLMMMICGFRDCKSSFMRVI
jgi:hypothetical protein